jgi:hypothetical protein
MNKREVIENALVKTDAQLTATRNELVANQKTIDSLTKVIGVDNRRDEYHEVKSDLSVDSKVRLAKLINFVNPYVFADGTGRIMPLENYENQFKNVMKDIARNKRDIKMLEDQIEDLVNEYQEVA